MIWLPFPNNFYGMDMRDNYKGFRKPFICRARLVMSCFCHNSNLGRPLALGAERHLLLSVSVWKRPILCECLIINPCPAGSHSVLRVTLFAWRSGSSLTCIWVEFAPPQTGSWGTDPGQPCSPPEPARGLTASTWEAKQAEPGWDKTRCYKNVS